MARILVIEDNPDNLDLMSYLLGAFGHTVLIAEDGESGIEAARREKPDLVACDIHLPGVDGYAVAKTLRADASLRGMPLIAVTALAMVGDREKILAAGFDGCITKPIDPPALVGQIDAFLHAEKRGSKPENGFEHRAAPETTAAPARHALILVVDDAPTNRELIYQTLSPYGYDVRLAENVPAAMDQLHTLKPDLILSDLHMPGEDGFNFVRRVKGDATLSSIPFIFISSSVWGENDRATATELGVSRFLLRPIEPQRLIAEIERYLPDRQETTDGHDPCR